MSPKAGDSRLAYLLEWAVVLWSMVQGVYMFTDYYQSRVGQGVTPLSQLVSSPFFLESLAAVYIVSALMILYGLITHDARFRSSGLFINVFVARTFVLAATFIGTGILPLTWLSGAFVMFAVGALWWHERRMVRLYGR